jgi:hypothetical protein
MISSGNALGRSLYESAIRNMITEGTHADHNGDKWDSALVVRNETHPECAHFAKSKNLPHLSGVRHEEESRQVFINRRSGSVHEGPLMVHPDGKASPHSHSGNPQLFHFSHYFETEE